MAAATVALRIALVAATARWRGIAVDLRLEDGTVVRGDAAKLRQILVNLLSNAVKFSPEGGRIAVASACRPDGRVAVSVSDRGIGIGIAADDLARVWQPSLELDGSLARRHDGSGLGPTIARGLAALDGAPLELASEAGSGTTATLVLPAERLVAPPAQRRATA